MDFDYFYNVWLPENSLTDYKKLYRINVYLDERGKIKGILWFDRCSGGFNCPYQTISLEVKGLHDVEEYNKVRVKVITAAEEN